MTATRIRKVKYRDGEIYVRAEIVENEGATEKEIHVKSREEARAEFYSAFAALAAPALALIEASSDWSERTTPIGLSISHSEDLGIGAVITCLVKCPQTTAPLVINTPHLSEQASEGNDNAPVLPGIMAGAIYDVIEEATKFMDGRRAQLDMFESAED